MSKVGFSGTQNGMSSLQVQAVSGLLDDPDILKAAHGDCIGADADFHLLARSQGLWIDGYPPLNYNKRAFCKFDFEHRPNEYLVRNKNIVDDSDFMVFTPESYEEVLRSGTWSTIRYARKKLKTRHIVWPNGVIKTEVGSET